MSELKITVQGPVGSGKSALLGEIEILCKALGVPVRYADPSDAASEKAMTHADWTAYLEMYKPSVVLHEKGPDQAALASAPVVAALQDVKANASPVHPGFHAAPVADERKGPIFKLIDDLQERAKKAKRYDDFDDLGMLRLLEVADRQIERINAALASAPVAGEAHQPVARVVGDDVRRYLAWESSRSAWEMPIGTPVFYAAPQASEAQCSCPSGDGSLRHPCAVHPQASEAVRQQRAGDVVAVLVYRSKGRSGVHGQTIGADGAGEFAVLYRGDEFAALVKANEEIRALEAAGHRLDFAAIIHGEGYSGPMLRQEYVTRAALSAQPGAQKEQ